MRWESLTSLVIYQRRSYVARLFGVLSDQCGDHVVCLERVNTNKIVVHIQIAESAYLFQIRAIMGETEDLSSDALQIEMVCYKLRDDVDFELCSEHKTERNKSGDSSDNIRTIRNICC